MAMFNNFQYILHTLLSVPAAYDVLFIKTEKYLAIMRPIRHYLVTKKNVFKILLGSWMTSMLIAVIPVVWNESTSCLLCYIIHSGICVLVVLFISYACMIYSFAVMFKVISKRVCILVSRATILLTCGRDRELWLCPRPEVRDSRTSRQIWQIWLAENMKQILCACSENRFRPELSIPAAGQNDRGLWGREWRVRSRMQHKNITDRKCVITCATIEMVALFWRKKCMNQRTKL